MVLPAVLIIVASGCDKQTKHNVLTFFFTGVPSLEEEEKAAKTVKTEKTAEEPVVQTEKRTPRVVMYAHPLYTARRCDACHATLASLGFTASGSRGSSSIFGGTRAASPARLRVPVKKLCLECHEHKSVVQTSTKGLWLHTPATKGDCLACHDPHQSRNPYMLNKKLDQLCVECHLKDVVMNAGSHRNINGILKECLRCHNPHVGRDRLLLTKDYQEVKHPVGAVPGFFEPRTVPATQ
jgi:predicted CXXCH cytochrome family protein